MARRIALTVNGRVSRIEVDDPSMPLLYALRNELNLKGLHFGCGLAQCGACTVQVGAAAVRSCALPVSQAEGKPITTLEGIGETGRLHPLQQAFIDEQAAQCGYCTGGMIMQAKALLESNRSPSDEEIRRALAGNLCRCGSQLRVLRAVRRAARAMA
ncbi:MAG: (2Fe-2S)-binding protein [Pseudomonadota bacterium]|jgi:nicotinate dehydrogenase subunit A